MRNKVKGINQLKHYYCFLDELLSAVADLTGSVLSLQSIKGHNEHLQFVFKLTTRIQDARQMWS